MRRGRPWCLVVVCPALLYFQNRTTHFCEQRSVRFNYICDGINCFSVRCPPIDSQMRCANKAECHLACSTTFEFLQVPVCSMMASILLISSVADLYVDQELQSVRKTLRKPSLQWKTLRTGVTSTVEYLVELRKSEAKKLAPSSWMQVRFLFVPHRHKTTTVGQRWPTDLVRALQASNKCLRRCQD